MFEGVFGKKEYEKEISFNHFGKPFFRDHFIFFNMSGIQDFIVFVINEDGDIGVDIEKKREFTDAVLWGFFHEEERQLLKQIPDDFIRIWTRKEAFLKCIGTGWSSVTKNQCSVIPNCLQYNNRYYYIEDHIFQEKFILSICYDGILREKTGIGEIEEIELDDMCRLRQIG
jgi:phosphopantetheinyl transferase